MERCLPTSSDAVAAGPSSERPKNRFGLGIKVQDSRHTGSDDLFARVDAGSCGRATNQALAVTEEVAHLVKLLEATVLDFDFTAVVRFRVNLYV